MVGRHRELQTMHDILVSKTSAFLAVTGRRRVGKTYMIDQVYTDHMCLRVTGIQDGDMLTQIVNFTQKIAEYSDIPIVTTPANWQEVFLLLKRYLQSRSKRKKQVIFLDELPWMATTRSGFIQLLAHLWNDYLSKEKHFVLVICGSATSWISRKIVNDKGGFHNRLTHHIRLQPFTLAETNEFFVSKKIRLTDQAITELYMTIGGIPYYLEQIEKGESVSQAIARTCFDKDGRLRHEYDNLYKALFDNASNHEAIIATLATSFQGMTRNELINKSKIQAGGPFTRALDELLDSGFVEEVTPYGRIKRGSVYRLADEYSMFYIRFIQPNLRRKSVDWQRISQSQSYKIWTGYAFEALCLKHIQVIKSILGIEGVQTHVSGFRQKGSGDSDGFQIDLIIDRQDQVINLCECKYYNEEFVIDKTYAKKLQYRRNRFIEKTKTKKTVLNTVITIHGLKQNEYALDAVDQSIEVAQLFA